MNNTDGGFMHRAGKAVSARFIGTSAALVAIAAATMASGFIREIVLAAQFGAGPDTDAFYFAWALVQALNNLLLGGVLGSTIIPLLQARRALPGTGSEHVARFTVTATVLVVVATGMLSMLGWFFMPWIVDVLSPGMPEPLRARSVSVGRALIPLLPLNALLTLYVLILNAHDHFVRPALVHVVNNVIFSAVLVLFASALGGDVLALAALAGPLLTTLWLAVQLSRMGVLCLVRVELTGEFFRPFWRLSRPMLFSLGIGSAGGLLMASHLAARSFAANYGGGAIAALGYAFRLYEVPISLIANPTASIMLPAVATLFASGRMAEIRHHCRQMLFWGLIALFPAALVTWGAADTIVAFLLQRGSFDAEATRITAEALRGFAPAVMAEAGCVVLLRVFYALHRPDRPVIVGLVALASLIVLLLFAAKGAFVLIPLSISAAFVMATGLLMLFLVRTLGWGALPGRDQILRWLLSAAIALAVWRMAASFRGGGANPQLLALGAFLVAYTLGVATFLPECRRVLADLLLWRVNRTG